MTDNKKILGGVGVAGAVLALVLFNGKPVNPNTFQPAPLVFNGKEITFTCGDDNTGEDVVIKTDKCTYSEFGTAPVVFSVSNLSNQDQMFDIQFFGAKNEKLSAIETYQQTTYQVEVEDKGDVVTECKDGWVHVEGEDKALFDCQARLRSCDEITKQGCVQHNKVTGTHQEDRVKDEWIPLAKAVTKKDFSLEDRKPQESKYKAKDQFRYSIPSGQTRYFRAMLDFSLQDKENQKFFIKAFGDLGSFGNLDPWYNASWGYRMQMTVNTSKVGTTTLSSYPALVSTTTPNLKYTGSGGHVGKSDGTDILFTDSDGSTKLPHELETYASSTGQLIAWVKVPTVSSSTAATIFAYYGNAGASDQQDRVNTWDSNYGAVYHMNQTVSGAGYNINDSTSNNRTLQSFITTAGNVVSASSQIGNGLTFSGGNQYQGGYLASSTINSGLGTGTSLTWSGWFYLPSSRNYDSGYNYLIQRVDGYPYHNAGLKIQNGNANVAGSISDNSGNFYSNAYSAISLTTFYYVVATYDGATLKTYVNGALTASTSLSITTGGDAPLYIAWSPADGFRYTEETVDEVRLSSSTRNDSWIYTEYNNQSSPGTFWTYGVEEPYSPGTPSIKFRSQTLIIE